MGIGAEQGERGGGGRQAERERLMPEIKVTVATSRLGG